VEKGVLCSLATMFFCIDPSVRIVTKSPKVEPLLIFSISLAEIYERQQEKNLRVNHSSLATERA
jgi:hypothetical protein